MIRSLLLTLSLLFSASAASAQELSPGPDDSSSGAWMETMRAIPIQDGGRIMALDSYANNLAVQLTGRTRWSEARGPEAYAGRDPIQLFCDLLFKPDALMHAPLIAVEHRPFKTLVGLDPMREFFSPIELASCQGINEQLMAFNVRRQQDSSAPPLPDQKRAIDLSNAVDRIAQFSSRTPLPIIPAGAGEAFLRAGPTGGQPGTEAVQAALASFGQAYVSGTPLETPAQQVADAIASAGTLSDRDAAAIKYELFYNDHSPWRLSAMAYLLSIIAFGFSRLILRKPLTWLAFVFGVWGVAEQSLGTGLRVAILGRAPVSNTYESLLWMGLVAIGIGLIFQATNRKGYYLFAGVCAALVSVLFAGLVPIQDQTNALPAVLRSNYWLIIHVLTIVASYGVLLVASVLGHVYLIGHVLMGRENPEPTSPDQPHPLIHQTYRTIQIGLVLLTAGTILGGVWAADSWGRFWGWDPKETWALISIVIYFALLHARIVGWLKDFGLAASAILGFAAIVWTFYGVNYVMATGLHSYGFGAGGEIWVMGWAVAEIIFLVLCWWRYVTRNRANGGDDLSSTEPVPEPSAT